MISFNVETGRTSAISSGVPVQLTDADLKANLGIQLLADPLNTDEIWVGSRANITRDVSDETDGFPIKPGQGLVVPARSIREILVRSSGATQKLWWFLMGDRRMGKNEITLPILQPGFLFWFDSLDSSIVIRDALNNIDPWEDKSGFGNNASQLTLSKKPLYIEDFSDGLPAVDFDGTDDFLTLGNNSSLEVDDFSFFAVIKQAPLGGAGDFLGIQQDKDVTDRSGIRFINDVLGSDLSINLAIDSTSIFTINPAAFFQPDKFLIMTVIKSGTSIKIYRDGQLKKSSNSAPATIHYGSANRETTIGATKGGVSLSDFFGGPIREMVFYNHAKNTVEQQFNENYFSNRWNIPLV